MKAGLAVFVLGAVALQADAALRGGASLARARSARSALAQAKKSELQAAAAEAPLRVQHASAARGADSVAQKAPQAAALVQLGASARRTKKAAARQHAQAPAFPQGIYQYGSPMGNGYQDFRTPHYGTFSGQYGPIGQPATPGQADNSFGLGSFSANMDPRGFGAALANYSAPWEHGVHPLWPVPPSPYPMKVPQPYSPWNAQPPFSQQGYNALAAGSGSGSGKANMTFMGPQPFGPFGVNAHAFYPHGPGQWAQPAGVYGMYPGFGFPRHGVIPTTQPFAMGAMGGGYNPLLGPGVAAGMPGMQGALNPQGGLNFQGAMPGMQGGMPGMQGYNGQMAGQMPVPAAVGNSPMYSGARMHPLVPPGPGGMNPTQGVSGNGMAYPHPDWDRYNSVPSMPPPPAGGAGSAGSGSA